MGTVHVTPYQYCACCICLQLPFCALKLFQKSLDKFVVKYPPYTGKVNVLKFRTLYCKHFWPSFCFLCSCFFKYLVEWQTVKTLIRLVWSEFALFAYAILYEILIQSQYTLKKDQQSTSWGAYLMIPKQYFLDFLYKSICCWYSFELLQLVEAIQMSTSNIRFYKQVYKSTLAVI